MGSFPILSRAMNAVFVFLLLLGYGFCADNGTVPEGMVVSCEGLEDVTTIIPESRRYSKVVLFMHGVHGAGWTFKEFLPKMNLRDTKYILPTAKLMHLPGGVNITQWAVMLSLRFNGTEDHVNYHSAAGYIRCLIDMELRSGIPGKNIVVGGFSQGGALALHVALRYPHTLGAVITLSSWLPLPNDYPAALSPSNAHLPILQVQGGRDGIVTPAWAWRSHQHLATIINNPRPQYVLLNETEHSYLDERIFPIVGKFLRELYGQQSAAVRLRKRL